MLVEPTDLNVIREDLRSQALEDQDHVKLHLFAENDTLREMVGELYQSKMKLETVLDTLHAERTEGASM